VNHHPRTKGKSKYGMGRTFKVMLDLITAKFFSSYLNKPSYFFGGTGMLLVLCGFWAGLFPIVDKFLINRWGHLRIPFMIFSIFLGLLGVQFIVLGLLAEILIRIYYENKDERPYRIAEVVTSGRAAPPEVGNRDFAVR
ncbi:MAG: glycosyltransferase, partial [Elusimicrobia bacterium]|nr:glycosyltransferase [Elusimicrobiota bacterium]